MNFRSEKEKQLIAFLQATFGELLSLFLLSGLGEEGWVGRRYFTISELDYHEKIIRHRLVLTSYEDTFLPHGLDPLVLAALLKLLFDRGKTYRMNCRLVELRAVLGWDDLAGTGKSVAGALERYYAASLAVMPPLEEEPHFGESPTFVLRRRILLEYETPGTGIEGGLNTDFGVAFNPDFTLWLRRKILLGIDWERVMAVEV
jgi:hypothetical protein